MTSAPQLPAYPGERLGRPPEGSGSVAGWGRRVLALVIDWLASMLVAALFIGSDVWSGSGPEQWLTLALFAAECTVLVPLVGGSFGQLVTGIAVIARTNRPPTLLRSLLRALLVCLVIPPLVFNRDHRGLHDLVADTVVIRR